MSKSENAIVKLVVRTWLRWRRPSAPNETVKTCDDDGVHRDKVNSKWE